MLDNFALTTNTRYLLLALIFLIVMGSVIIAVNVTRSRSAVRGRLSELGHASGGPESADKISLRGEAVSKGWSKLAEMIEKTGLSLVDTKGDSLRAKLVAAGYKSPIAPKIFTLVRLGLLILLPAIFVFFFVLQPKPPSLIKLYLIGVGLGLAGLYLPNLFVTAKADRRKQEIVNSFPDCLDLMLVCVEAGLGMEAAFDRVGREMVIPHPMVAEMLSIVTMELRAGSTREEALRNMADRTQVEEIRSFATLLIQSDRLGSSVGETLRVYAAEMREKRRMRAEEKAHRLPVLLSVPLVACMLPVMIGVLMLPAAVRVIRQIIPVLGN